MASSPQPSSVRIQMSSPQTSNAIAPPTPKGGAENDSPTTMRVMAASAGSGTMADKVMTSASNLAQLLPTGTVLAYQALSPSFTNHGTCTVANQWLTAALVGVLAGFSLFFSFTDSVVGRDGKLYYGVATPRGFNVFNFSGEEEEREWAVGQLRRLRLRPRDYVHALFAAVVFLTVAFSDVGLQKCFFPGAGENTHELLKNLPLGTAFLSSFVFLIFPTTRKGIGYNDTTPQQKATAT
ncbi:unnamed protein product [Miscanthus lutarioriparius]|uniref:Uncharacterized protein n=1 Tax=Miscanthus lutarioriparius TaxID=422564 RepID=A0A811SFV8_9POAL|nr:unnamed protein product [Miscanthus lutarioriparius]